MMIRAFWAVFVAELLNRRLMLGAAAIVGFLPLIFPALPGLEGQSPSIVRQSALLLVMLFVLSAGPLALGSSLFSQDLQQGRLSFFFSRPIGDGALWLGKLAAAWVLLIAGLVLAMAPTLVVESKLGRLLVLAEDGPALPLLGYPEVATLHLPGLITGSRPPAVFFIVLVLILATAAMLATHAVSTFIRVRSPWLFLDSALGVLLIGLVILAREILLRRQAYDPLGYYEFGLIAGFSCALAMAIWPQLRSGRTAPLRSRSALALALWPGLYVVAFAGLIYAFWAVHPEWEDVKRVSLVQAASDGKHAVVAGPLKGRGEYRAIFLADLESGEKTFLGSEILAEAIRFSEDGGRLFWLDCRRLVPLDCEMAMRDLRAGTGKRSTDIPIQDGPRPQVDLSPGGELFVNANWNAASVYATVNGKLLGAIQKNNLQDARFLDLGRVLLAIFLDGRTRLDVWDLEQRRVSKLVELPGDWQSREQYLDRDRQRLFYNTVLPRVHQVWDLESGELVADLLPIVDEYGALAKARWLEDGRLLLVVAPILAPELEVEFDITLLLVDLENGVQVSRLEMPAIFGVRIGPELSSGAGSSRILVAKRHRRPPPPPALLEGLGIHPLDQWSTWMLDLPADGELTIRAVAGGLRPQAEDLFLARDGALVRWEHQGAGEMELVLVVPD